MFEREIDWLIHYKCNYRCSYCFFEGMWDEVENKNTYFPIEKLVESWRKVWKKYGNLKLIITGGEPFTYPDFPVLLRELTSFFHISFDTNLSCSLKTVGKIKETINPAQLFMGLSFHPEFADRDAFEKKANILKESGIDCRIHFVTYPPYLKDMEGYREFFQRNGFRFTPIPFRGEYKERSYPDSFSEEEKEQIYETTRNICEKDREWADSQVEQIQSKDKLCRAGQKYVRVDCDGTVYRCANDFTKGRDKDSLGNIFKDTFSFSEKPVKCRQDTCPCEFRWLV